jgi:hypothetical protein
MTRTGRPPEFVRPRRFLVTLDADEHRRLQVAARADRLSASAWVRRVVLAALVRHGRRRRPR